MLSRMNGGAVRVRQRTRPVLHGRAKGVSPHGRRHHAIAKFEKGAARIRTAYDGLFGEVDDGRQCVDRIADALNQRSLDKRLVIISRGRAS